MMGSETLGIIYPPPELRNIVDKTAGFVARNGPEFEFRIQQNEQHNPKFNFLRPGDPYNAYYAHKVKELRESAVKAAESGEYATPAAGDDSKPGPNEQDTGQAPDATTTPKQTAKQQELAEAVSAARRGPPPDWEFMIEPPSISALDLDVVKLTAQFVAIHGRSFLTNLMNRESRNYQFDFLRPQHGLFSYFTQLIEQYTKVLMPSQSLLEELKKDAVNQKHVMQKVTHRLGWTKINEAEKRKEEEEAEKERIQYAQIDWHDFVVVETVDYQPNESGENFPPPTTPEQVGSRILFQQRMEEQDETEMDVESDEEMEDSEPAEKQESVPMPPPLPPSLDNVLIRKDYNPKLTRPTPETAAPSGSKDSAWVISPITGERIPADKLQEHIRYSLLDPKWVEERERTVQEKMQQEEVFAPGTAIESSLKQLAERRTDIFGSGNEETAIGKKIGEQDDRRPEKVTWDGHKASAESTLRDAKKNITVEEQITHIHRMKGLLPDDGKDKIGPAMPQSGSSAPLIATRPPMPSIPSSSSSGNHHIMSAPSARGPMQSSALTHQTGPSVSIVTSQVSAQPNQPLLHHQPQPQHMQAGMSGGLLPPPSVQQQQQQAQQPFMMAPHLMMGMYGMPVPGAAPLMPMGIPPPPSDDEPSSKRLRTDDNLVAEDDFLQSNPNPVSFSVQVPDMPDRSDCTLRGQLLSVTMRLEETITAVKTKVHEATGLPPGKQKLQFDRIYPKDSNTLAFYNVYPNSVMILTLKERGGRKK